MKIVLTLIMLLMAAPVMASDCGTLNTDLLKAEYKDLHPDVAEAVIGLLIAQYECEHRKPRILETAEEMTQFWGRKLDSSVYGTPAHDQAWNNYLFWSDLWSEELNREK